MYITYVVYKLVGLVGDVKSADRSIMSKLISITYVAHRWCESRVISALTPQSPFASILSDAKWMHGLHKPTAICTLNSRGYIKRLQPEWFLFDKFSRRPIVLLQIRFSTYPCRQVPGLFSTSPTEPSKISKDPMTKNECRDTIAWRWMPSHWPLNPDDLLPFRELVRREWSSASVPCRVFDACVGMSCVLCVSGCQSGLQMTRLEIILPLLW